jgi:hypothetical protein
MVKIERIPALGVIRVSVGTFAAEVAGPELDLRGVHQGVNERILSITNCCCSSVSEGYIGRLRHRE